MVLTLTEALGLAPSITEEMTKPMSWEIAQIKVLSVQIGTRRLCELWPVAEWYRDFARVPWTCTSTCRIGPNFWSPTGQKDWKAMGFRMGDQEPWGSNLTSAAVIPHQILLSNAIFTDPWESKSHLADRSIVFYHVLALSNDWHFLPKEKPEKLLPSLGFIFWSGNFHKTSVNFEGWYPQLTCDFVRPFLLRSWTMISRFHSPWPGRISTMVFCTTTSRGMYLTWSRKGDGFSVFKHL